MVKQKEAESQYSDCLAARHRDGSEWKPTDTDKIHTPLQHLLQTNKPLDLSFSKGFPGGTTGKESICQCRRCKRQGFDPWVRKKPWGRKYHLLQYSSLGNPMNRGAWWAIVHGITESDVRAKEKSKLRGESEYTAQADEVFPICFPTPESNEITGRL